MRNNAHNKGLGCLLVIIALLLGTLWVLNREPEKKQDTINRIPIP